MHFCIITAIIYIIIAIVTIILLVQQRGPRVRSHKVVLLGLDGLGVPNLRRANTPNLDSLYYQEVSIDPNSYDSGPNWVGMLTGHNSDTSGISNNECILPAHKTLFDEYPSAVYTQWDIIQCYSHNIQRYTYAPYTGELFNETLLKDTLDGNESFVFIHIDVLDHYSHLVGADTATFVQALEAIDSKLMPLLMSHTLVVASDHGSKQGGKGHSYDRVPILTQHATSHSSVYFIVHDYLVTRRRV